MYTFGLAPFPAGLGPGSAGWAAAPGGCVWLWVRGLRLSVSLLLCGPGLNLLGGPPPLLPGVRWPRVWPAVPVWGPGRAARAGGSGRRPWGCPPWGPVPWSRVLSGSRSLALVAVAVPSSSSGACEVALVVAGVVAWR